MARSDPETREAINKMVLAAHGQTDVGAPDRGQDPGESSTQPAPAEEQPAPTTSQEAPEKAPSEQDPEVLRSTLQRISKQRDELRSAQEAQARQIAELQEQLRETTTMKELRKLLTQEPPKEESVDEDQASMLHKMQQVARWGYEQAMKDIDVKGMRRLSVKDALQSELGGDLTAQQLDAVTDLKMSNPALTGPQARVLASAEHPELFESPKQTAGEKPPDIPPSHRMHTTRSDIPRTEAEPKKKSADQEFAEARARKDYKGMRSSLSRYLTEELIAPAWNAPIDNTGRVVKRAPRVHIRVDGSRGKF